MNRPGLIALAMGLMTVLSLHRFTSAGARTLPQVAGPVVTAVSHDLGYAGHSVVFTGTAFGSQPGSVTWGDEPCVVTAWSPTQVTAYLPDGARPGTKPLVVGTQGQESGPVAFTVIPPEFEPSTTMSNAWTFMRTKMRNPEGGVYTTFLDVDSSDEVYLHGHNVTAEHMGLMLWVAAAMLDHQTFEESFQYVSQKMISPHFNVVNWGVDKATGQAAVQPDETGALRLHANAPLDDFRVVKGFIAGWMQWQDERYRQAALRVGQGLLETSVSAPSDFPRYPEGLVTIGFLWDEEEGDGDTESYLVPVNYADLWTMKWLAQSEPRWNPVIAASIRMMEDAQIPSSGQFYGSYLQDTQEFSGNWEYQGSLAGTKVRSIQSLWTGIHLARVGRRAAAQRALDFYKARFQATRRISENYNYDGTDPTEPDLRDVGVEGEVRSYSQAARLAYYLGDRAFGDVLIQLQVVPAQNANPQSPVYGSLGNYGEGDAASYETLEGLIGLLLQRGSAVISPVFSD